MQQQVPARGFITQELVVVLVKIRNPRIDCAGLEVSMQIWGHFCRHVVSFIFELTHLAVRPLLLNHTAGFTENVHLS